MKTALIIGVSGNFGSEIARAMIHSGWQVKALMRDPSRRPKDIALTQVIAGDATLIADVESAAQGCDVLVYAANPKYHRWPQEAMAMLEPVAQVAQAHKLRILFPGNVYNFAAQPEPIHELVAMHPVTEKGQIRVQMEARLKAASQRGARVTIIRAGDFLGDQMHMCWLDFILKSKAGSAIMAMPHSDQHTHYWSYLPDLCANAAALLEVDQAAFEVWHDPGLALTTRDWQTGFASLNINARFRRLPWWTFRLIAPFWPMLREVLKMRYLWQQTVVLDGRKMRDALGDQLQRTPFTEILSAMWVRANAR